MKTEKIIDDLQALYRDVPWCYFLKNAIERLKLLEAERVPIREDDEAGATSIPRGYVGCVPKPSSIFLAGHVVTAHYSRSAGAYLSCRPIGSVALAAKKGPR